MELHRDDTSHAVLVLRAHGAEWLDGSSVERRLAFGPSLFRATLLHLRGGGLGVAGLSGRRDVPVLSLTDARTVATLRGGVYVRPLAGNILGDAASEVLLPDRAGIRVYSPDGEFLRTIRSPWYASDRTFVQADDDPELEITFVGTHLAGGPIDVHVVNADGSVVSAWHSERGNWISWIPALNAGALWGLASDGFVEWDSRGHELAVYPAEGVDYLRDVSGAESGGYVALVASGNGYRGRSVLNIYDRAKHLVYQEVFAGRTYSIIADPDASVGFLVGTNADVLRLRLAVPASLGIHKRSGH